MRKRFVVPGLTLALSIAAPGWAIRPAADANVMTVAPEAAGGSTVTGRVTSVDASGFLVIVETRSGLNEFEAVTVGDPVQILLETRSPVRSASNVASDGARPSTPAHSRRLLGVWLLTMSGVVIVLRVRRRHTFMTSHPREAVAPVAL